MTISQAVNDVDESLYEDIPSSGNLLFKKIGIPSALPKYHVFKEPIKKKEYSVIKVGFVVLFGLFLIWFGITSTGSYFEQSSRFSGFLASLWYGYQFGNVISTVGIIMIYDSMKRIGYL
jgi:hypothetical protein